MLYYNRFRYYSLEEGLYISKDPIGLARNNPNAYAYTHDSNTMEDIFGLSEGCGTLGRNMSKVSMTHGFDPFIRGDFQAHHVIPHEVWINNQDFFDKVGLGGAKDKATNGVFLPKNQQVANSLGFDYYHRGSHPDINTNMETRLNDIVNKYNNGELTRTQPRKDVSKLQAEERSRLSQRNNKGAAIKCH